MRYLGNKSKLLEVFLEPIMRKVIEEEFEIKVDLFFDVFCGTGSVGEFFREKYVVFGCDLLYSSYLISKAKIECNGIPKFSNISGGLDKLLEILMSQSREGFIFQEYSQNGAAGRLYFSEENGKRIDGIIYYIHDLRRTEQIDELEFSYLYLILLEAIHSVSNTTGVYGAFLKKLNSNALRRLELKKYPIRESGLESPRGRVFWGDSWEQLKFWVTENSVLYLDPPYNHRQYGCNYHILETCCRGGEPQIRQIRGGCVSKSGLPVDLPQSNFCKKNEVQMEFVKYLELPASLYFISYNSESLLDRQQMVELLTKYGTVQVYEYDYKRYKSNTNREDTDSSILEYLFVLRKQTPNLPLTKIQPIIQWAGGKRRILNEIRKYLPSKFGKYYEPFLGGGSLLFELQPTRAVVVELNQVLVWTYEIVRDNLDNLLCILDRYTIEYHDIKTIKSKETGIPTRETYYKDKRDTFNKLKQLEPKSLTWDSKMELCALFLFLNRVGFNAIYRENLKGEFNVPFGNGKDRVLYHRDNMIAVSNYLKKIVLIGGSYETIVNQVEIGDFVYMDPPYHGSFSTYNCGGWSIQDSKNVIELFRELTERGVYVLLSNNNTDEYKQMFREIYPDDGQNRYKFVEISIARTLNSDINGRSHQNCELLIVGNPPRPVST